MKALNLIAGLVFACLATGTYAQSCAGHAQADAAAGKTTVESLSKELDLDAKQQEALKSALATCEKDCAAFAAKDVPAEQLTGMKKDRFNEAIASLKGSLSSEQFARLDAMNQKGQLSGLCGTQGCAKGAKAGCCAGKAGAQAAPQKTGVAVRAD